MTVGRGFLLDTLRPQAREGTAHPHTSLDLRVPLTVLPGPSRRLPTAHSLLWCPEAPARKMRGLSKERALRSGMREPREGDVSFESRYASVITARRLFKTDQIKPTLVFSRTEEFGERKPACISRAGHLPLPWAFRPHAGGFRLPTEAVPENRPNQSSIVFLCK